MQNYHGINVANGNNASMEAAAMEAAVAAAASQLGLDRLLDFGTSSSSGNGQSGGGGGVNKRSGRSSSSASPAATRSYCQICNKELCNKYFMKTHMLKMHGIHLEASGGGAQIGGVQCDICHKELCSKYFLKVHKQNTHGIGFPDHEMLPNGQLMKEHQQTGVMDLSFHQQQNVMEVSSSPAKSSASSTTECCPLCPKRFKSTKALKAHLSHDHSATTSASSGSASSASTCCYICNQQFGDVVALQVHLIKSHASHLMETPPSTTTTTAAAAPPAAPEQTGSSNAQGCVSSSSSPKTSPAPFQCSFCDFATGSLPYLFAHERTHHPVMDPPPPTSSASPPSGTQQKIQCPLCGQQLPLDQFQTHLMAHQLPVNFLHTLMPPSSAGTGPSHPDEEEDEADRSYQQQQQEQSQQGQKSTRRRRRRYRCSVCSRKFATRQLCLTHILQRHPPSIRSGNHNGLILTKSGISSPTSPVSCLVQQQQQQQRPLTCPRCGYATRQPQLLRLHLRTQQCIPVVARNPDLQQLPPYLAVPTSTASNCSNAQSRAVNNNGLLQVQGQHAHRQDFVLQAFLLTQPDADKKNRRSQDGQDQQQPNGHHHEDEAEMKREQQQPQTNGRPPHQSEEDRKRASSSVDADGEEEEGQNQSCNFIPSLILLPVNRRIANPLSLTFSLTPAWNRFPFISHHYLIFLCFAYFPPWWQSWWEFSSKWRLVRLFTRNSGGAKSSLLFFFFLKNTKRKKKKSHWI